MSDEQAVAFPYPDELRNWSGNRAGGVRRLFDDRSGRPGQEVYPTKLLSRLEEWANSYAASSLDAPHIVLLVGGPGNGKTEAVESTAVWLDKALGANGDILDQLRQRFLPEGAKDVPRLVRVQPTSADPTKSARAITIVQDASVSVGGRSSAQLLIEELRGALSDPLRGAHLCCVNRGVLDEALIAAIGVDDEVAIQLLEAITQAVSLSADSPPCWPLQRNPSVAVWPMDAESLIVPLLKSEISPAGALFEKALREDLWHPRGKCAAGSNCPFCTNRSTLARKRETQSLLRILRWYEVGSGKRWNFRDLFSLVSYLLAGHQISDSDSGQTPCAWAAHQQNLDKGLASTARPSREQCAAVFKLAASQYHLALFHRWHWEVAPLLLRDLKDLGLDDNKTARGFHAFLHSRRAAYLPAMITGSLEGVVDLMDPACASPDLIVTIPNHGELQFRTLDQKFSRSVTDGLAFVKPFGFLSKLDTDILSRLAALDEELSTEAVRRRKPAVSTRVQGLIRDFSCRVVRRCLGARFGIVRDAEILQSFQRVIEDNAGDVIDDVAREVESLLNSGQDFEISLNTTFGQPLPPAGRRATLVVPSRAVQPAENTVVNRPSSPISFLRVGSGSSQQKIALTYDLFKAIRELQSGMSVSSLPKSVLALLDTTRSRLSGPIVRDKEILDRAKIRLGSDGLSVVRRRSVFTSFQDRSRV